MRKLFGLAVLILGLLALWLWARSDHAKKMEAQISQAAETVAANSIHTVKSSVSGRDIRATGLADSDAERKSIIAALDEVEGRRVVVDELKVLETASPFIFMGKKGADGVEFSGNVPNEAGRAGFAKLIGDAAAAKLKLAGGMPKGDWGGFVSKGIAALNDLNVGSLEITDSKLTLTGLAADSSSAEKVRSAFSGLGDGYSAEINVLEIASPFTFSGKKTADGVIFTGNLPSEDARGGLAKLIGDAAAAKLKLAGGAPAGDWAGFVGKGVAALNALKSGALEIADSKLTLSGVAENADMMSKARAALDGLADGYGADFNVDLPKEVELAEISFDFSASSGAKLTGKTPKGLAVDKLAAALGLSGLTNEAKAGDGGSAGDGEAISSRLSALRNWLPFFESLKAKTTAKGIEIEGEIIPGADMELIHESITKEFGEGAQISFKQSKKATPDGTRRVNAVTGEDEISYGGFWMPEISFNAGIGSCEENISAILRRSTINFVTGSARLGAKSSRVINNLAATLRNCLASGALRVELGGHTDSQGDDTANMELSKERAEAVRQALLLRGVPGKGLQASGFGETQPIADNDTEEGRAANRRTTFIWFEN